MKNEPITHDKHYPPAASAQPNNAYYLHHCAVVERGPSYASCLSRLDDIKGGRSNERTAQCMQAVSRDACVAKGMREQEEIAGAAMFFFPRPANKPFLPVAVAGDFGVLITNHTDPALYETRPKAKPAPVVKDIVDAGTFANALNMAQVKDMVAATPKEDLPALSPTVANAGPTPGDSDLDRRIKALPLPIPPEPPKTVTTARPAMNPGETPLQYARRLATLKTSQT